MKYKYKSELNISNLFSVYFRISAKIFTQRTMHLHLWRIYICTSPRIVMFSVLEERATAKT